MRYRNPARCETAIMLIASANVSPNVFSSTLLTVQMRTYADFYLKARKKKDYYHDSGNYKNINTAAMYTLAVVWASSLY